MYTKTLEIADFLATQKTIKSVITRDGVILFEFYEHSFKKLKTFIDTLREYSPIIYGENNSDTDSILEYRPLKSPYFKLSMGYFEDVEDILTGLENGLKAIT